jgi:hypothetical protein
LVGVREGGAALIVRGDAGIGKSALLAAARSTATNNGMLVLSTTGVQSEADLPFAGLHQLLRPILDRLRGLPPVQRDAVRAAFGMAPAAGAEPFLIGLAALGLLSDAAEAKPLAVLVEDAHWLDRPTADALAFVGRRVDSDPIVLLAATREGYESPLLEAGLPELHVDGLAEEPARQLLDAHFPTLAPTLRERLLGDAVGNPLALLELPAVYGVGIGEHAVLSSPCPVGDLPGGTGRSALRRTWRAGKGARGRPRAARLAPDGRNRRHGPTLPPSLRRPGAGRSGAAVSRVRWPPSSGRRRSRRTRRTCC